MDYDGVFTLLQRQEVLVNPVLFYVKRVESKHSSSRGRFWPHGPLNCCLHLTNFACLYFQHIFLDKKKAMTVVLSFTGSSAHHSLSVTFSSPCSRLFVILLKINNNRWEGNVRQTVMTPNKQDCEAQSCVA